jgi:hypothetical protein
MKLKKVLVLVGLFFTFLHDAVAQVEMADAMRSNGKIYVVVAVILVILLTLFIYIIRLDLKLKKVEEQSSNK